MHLLPHLLQIGGLCVVLCLIEKKGDLAEVQIVAAKMNPGVTHVFENGHHSGTPQQPGLFPFVLTDRLITHALHQGFGKENARDLAPAHDLGNLQAGDKDAGNEGDGKRMVATEG